MAEYGAETYFSLKGEFVSVELVWMKELFLPFIIKGLRSNATQNFLLLRNIHRTQRTTRNEGGGG